MNKFKKFEKASSMILDKNRNVVLAGYSRVPVSSYDENGVLIDNKDLKFNYTDGVIRVYDDGIFVFGLKNGWLFCYKTWGTKNKAQRHYILSEIEKINRAYERQVLLDELHLSSKYS
jgi:hypothetical protein